MMKSILLSVLLLSLSVNALSSHGLVKSSHGRLPLGVFKSLQNRESHEISAAALTFRYPARTLDVPISHFPTDSFYDPHEEGSFKLRYWFDAQHYRSGGPVFLLDSGETNAENRIPFLDKGILSILSKATGGVGIILEHRYYGESFPAANLSTDNLRFLTTEQSNADLRYFVKHVQPPEIGKIDSNPIILYGGSYAGAKVAFARVQYPDVFFGAIASSGVVHAQVNYWNYFEPIRKFGPENCISAIINTVQLVDSALALKIPFVTRTVKSYFGLGNVTDDQDFVNTLSFPLGEWQGRNWDKSISDEGFFTFCHNITQAEETHQEFALTSPSTWAGAKGYARYIKENVATLCPDEDQNSCFGTSNATEYQQVGLEQSAWRSWTYQYCTEWGYFQVAAPEGTPSLLSRLLDVPYAAKICQQAFPPGNFNRVPKMPNVTRVNQYGDFDLMGSRIAFIDGEEDPWIGACVHSDQAKHRSKRVDSLETPYKLIKGGVHHWDENGAEHEPKEIAKIHAEEVEFVKHWLEHFEAQQKPKDSRKLVLQQQRAIG